MEKVTDYHRLRKPERITEYSPDGKRFKLIVFPKNSDGSEVTETFCGGPDRCGDRAQETAYRAAMIYIRDFYRIDVAFQTFINNNVHITDPFTYTKRAWHTAFQAKTDLCHYFINENNKLHAIIHQQTIYWETQSANYNQLIKLNNLISESLLKSAQDEIEKLKNEMIWKDGTIKYLQSFKDIRLALNNNNLPTATTSTNSGATSQDLNNFDISNLSRKISVLIDESAEAARRNLQI